LITNPITGCKASDEIRILNFVDGPANPQIIRNGDSIKVVNPIAGFRYQWRINGATNPSDTLYFLLIPANATSVNLVVQNEYGCTRTTANLLTGVSPQVLGHEVAQIFPNPAKDQYNRKLFR
jgi:hypothetical protein